jgi:hypothetical protein
LSLTAIERQKQSIDAFVRYETAKKLMNKVLGIALKSTINKSGANRETARAKEIRDISTSLVSVSITDALRNMKLRNHT